MNMSDEQFELEIKRLPWALCQDLRARDTAQREALARVEEEAGMLAAHVKATAAQAQLEEAVGLLYTMQELMRTIGMAQSTPPRDWHQFFRAEVSGRISQLGAFLARYAQAEQQEAQGAQAVDEQAAFEAWFTEKAKTLPLLRGESVLRYHNGEGQYVSDWALFGRMVWQARAALATQPALRKHVAPVSIVTFEKAITEEALAAGFNEPDLRRHEVDGCEVYAQQHIQAAYSGWKLALEVSPAQQAIDLLVEALVAPNTPDLPGRIDSFLDSQPAVRGEK